MNVDRRRIFTIGAVWFDFVKRLPRTGARFRSNVSEAEQARAFSLQQMTPQQASQLAAMQQQAIQMHYRTSNPFSFPWL